MPIGDWPREVLHAQIRRAAGDLVAASAKFTAAMTDDGPVGVLAEDIVDTAFRLQCAAVALDGLGRQDDQA
ncbi:hypothetical protein [Streptomyces sp. NPDC057910]|uniref:hypothetical protein n=1 Tax=Streptomyces sp. NPDC057910 TaxID=3346278 RepID=UPI0036EDF618